MITMALRLPAPLAIFMRRSSRWLGYNLAQPADRFPAAEEYRWKPPEGSVRPSV